MPDLVISRQPLEIAARFVAVTLLIVALAACPGDKSGPPPVPPGPSVQVFVTAGDQSKLLAAQPDIQFTSNATPGPLLITVDAGTRYQEIDGFGSSLTDSSAWLIWNKLGPSQQSDLMQRLFSRDPGIGISFLRQPMGASDFAVSGNYSYDDVPEGQTDPDLTNFSIAHDSEYIVPLITQARAMNSNLKVVALPWSPPAWMKVSGTMNGGSIDRTYFGSLAQYFVKFIQAYQQRGIPIYAVSVQNEPLYSTTDYPSAHLSAADEADFIANHLGPALTSAGLGSVKIFAYDHNWDHPEYPQSVLAGPASNYVAGTAFHCYAGDVTAQSNVKTAYPEKDIWFTECSGTVGSSFAGDLVWNSQHLLIGATRNWARSISLWNLALDQDSGPKNGGCSKCRGVVTIDDRTTPPTITYNVEYYVLGHLGKFVVPGARRIASNSLGSGGIEDVAFQNPDGSIVLFTLNSAASPASFTVSWKGRAFNYSLPAQSVATFLWK